MKNLIKRIILDFHNRPYPSYKLRHAVFPRGLEKIITIIGPRRAGKTYFLFQIMDKLEQQGVPRHHMLYLNFEDERLDFADNYDPIIEAWQELYPELDISQTYFFFDEIQEAPNWEKFIRRLYDSKSRHIVLTGSNARMLSKDIATSLRGRNFAVEIMPLSFREFLEFKAIDPADRYSTQNSVLIQNAFEEYMRWGGYPELVALEPYYKSRILQEYFNVMIFRDLVERYRVKDVALLKYVIKRLISSFSKEFSVNKIFNEMKTRGLSVNKNQIYQMVEQIFSIYILAPVEKYNPSIVKREMSNKKVYLYDNGLVSITKDAAIEERGKLLENLVFSQLRRHTEALYFLKNGWECDFLVVARGKAPWLLQVVDHLHDDNYRREFKGLCASKKLFPQAKPILLYGQKDKHLSLPEGIEGMIISDWLLSNP